MSTIKGRPSDPPKSRKVTPPSPSYMSSDQFAKYLADLRTNRVARPGGARPQPAGARPAPSRMSTGRASAGRDSLAESSHAETQSVPPETRAESPSVAAGSISSRYSSPVIRSRDSYSSKSTVQPLKPSEVVPTATYIERGQRWMEKEEASSLRDAMHDMDLKKSSNRNSVKSAEESPDEEESRIYNAALDEAAELVWQHQHPSAAPEPHAPYRYRSHLKKNSYAFARTASVGGYTEDGEKRTSGSRSVSDSSTGSEGYSRDGQASVDVRQPKEQSRQNSKPYGSMGASSSSRPDHRRRSSMKRNISGEVQRPFSGDQIWEEPEPPSKTGTPRPGAATADALASRPHNPLRRSQPPSDTSPVKPLNRVEIYRNPPTQSRNAQYTINSELPRTSTDDQVERKNGVEVRSQDIRNATSMKIKDRSPKLPEPTAVSDNPGRPIVSFNANWKAPDESTDANSGHKEAAPQSGLQSNSTFQPQVVDIPIIAVEEGDPSPSRSQRPTTIPSFSIGADDGSTSRPLPSTTIPSITIGADDGSASRPRPPTTIPSISIGEHDGSSSRPVPSINIPDIAIDEPTDRPNVPVISTPDSRPAAAPRSLPDPKLCGQRRPRAPLPAGRGHWSPAPGAVARQSAKCHECFHPIEGRFVALAGSSDRFHPHCLRCFTCGMGLEAMEISPEPDHIRAERVDRIRRRAAGEILEETPGMTMAEDGDDRLRFFCHLDWHELYAPRCRHCKTPILGEHIVALGEHWHYGHFFCAECGDPFEQGMTHIEKDGYAWCVKCQTKRTERRAPKCKKCRTAVIGQYIQALGGEWHEHCFRCAECQGGFDDGQIFPKDIPGGMVVLCTGCRARELKR
ncbi:unnamed protein product [Clonostachys solani]|uniref:LIM zinc-binding domain-containing protein n=1 Tax=Clonostachys solani TaxID=160281 RepID=A0A9P0EAS3_9HYPO|nr:unnamed protein product [Clonostachys solani]